MTSKQATVFSCTFTPVAPKENWSAAKKKEWADNRRFYSCNALPGETDVMAYMLDPEKTAKPDRDYLWEQAAQRLDIDLSDRLPSKSEAKNIAEYMTRFNTLGAFGLHGAMTEEEMAEWRENAQKTQATLYHGVLSLPARQSELVGYEDMEKLVRQTFGGFLKNAGFEPKNVALMCAVHNNTENTHFHFTFYERAPMYRDNRGELHYRRKWKIDEQALKDYRMSTTAYLDENKRDLTGWRNAAVAGIRALTVTPSDRALYIELCELADKLPKRGRLQYNSENVAPFRKDIDRMAMMLLRKNPDALAAHVKALREIKRREKALGETGTKSDYGKRLLEEYKSRLGNAVLGMVKNFRTDPKSAARGEPETCKQHKAAARRRRSHGARVIKTALKVLSGGKGSVQADFTYSLHKAEREIEYETAMNNNGAKH